MRAAATYSAPFLHSCQNVPSPAINTISVPSAATTTTTTTTRSSEVQVDAGIGAGTDTDATSNCTETKIHCDDSSDSSNTKISRNNHGSNSCCQREYKNYGKHAMLKCPSSMVAQRANTSTSTTSETIKHSSKKSRERRKVHHHHCLHVDTLSKSVVTGAAASSAAATVLPVEPNARLRSTYATITTTGTLEKITKSSLKLDDEECSDAFAVAGGRESEMQDVSSGTAFAAGSPTPCGHMHSHSCPHSHSHSHTSSCSYSHTHSIILKTQSCLADSLRLRNKRQLVMPIVENSLGNTVAMQQQLQQQKIAAEHSRCDEAAPAPLVALQRTTAASAQLERPQLLAALQVGCTTETDDAATTIDNSQTTIKPTTTKKRIETKTESESEKERETFDCRCFKENGDILMIAERSATQERCEPLAAVVGNRCGIRLCHNADETTTKLLPGRTTQQRLNSLPTASIATISTMATPTFTLMPTLPLLLRKRLLAMDKTSAPVWWRSKLLLYTLLVLMLTSTANCWAGRQDVPTNCTFPSQWQGSWFLSGYQQSIHIKGSQFSYRGRCAASDGNKYLIVDEKGCHRCLVIYEKHKNVLQYKESECEGDSMYMHQTNPSAMAMRSVLKQNDHRGGAHPNLNSNNGHSRLSSSDQYIMRSNDDMNDYFCKGRETLQNLCDQIPGDALLYSLFRESAEPVKCPLKGPFIFTYNRGHGECKSPHSNIESCTEDSRLLLSFQACPDVQGTESTVEELTCLATWKDGNSRYLVGLVSHHHAISNEERYRCFVYEKISSLLGGPSLLSSKDAEYKLAQSGDATCNGLDSAEVGSRIMSLRKPPLTERCDFPTWFKGPRHWHVLMGNAVYNYHPNDGSVHIIKPNGFMETRALCEQINKQTSTEMMAVVHYTTGCQSGFMCMMFYRRDTHVIEIQTGKQASRLEDACAPDHFDIRMPYITLLASNPDPQICPMEGLYNLRGAIGPPFSTTRHKRNHSNKLHAGHGHHHAQSELGTAIGAGGSNGNNAYAHKRHTTLSFRNSEKLDKGSWHANTRGLPVRSRRATDNTVSDAREHIAEAETHINLLGEKSLSQANTVEMPVESRRWVDSVVTNGTTTSVDFVKATNTELAHMQARNRRDAPGCITNYKAQRRLWIGCTDPDVIDVRPLCNDNGDEEYSCHGSWTENGTVYIIARHTGTKHGVCISYRPTEGNAAKLVIGDACYRGTQKPPEHHIVANLTVFGKCGETGSDSTQMRANYWLVLILAVASNVLLMNTWPLAVAMSAIDAPVIISR